MSRDDGSYGPIPSRTPLGMLSMPFNSTALPGLYCVGDSTFPGQVRVCFWCFWRCVRLFSPLHPSLNTTNTHKKKGVNAVVFSGFGCAHRAAVDLGLTPGWPLLDKAFGSLLGAVRDRA